MTRSYIVTLPGQEPQEAKNPSKAADLIGGGGKGGKGQLVSQLAGLGDGDSVTLGDGVQVQVVGQDDEDEEGEPTVPPGSDEVPVAPPSTEGNGKW